MRVKINRLHFNFFILFFFLSPFLVHAENELDKIKYIVNQDVILDSDIQLARKLMKVTNKNAPTDSTNFQEQVEEKLILDTILHQRAQRYGIKIDDERLDQSLNMLAQNTNTTVGQIRAEMEAVGVSYQEYREAMRKEVTISELRNAEIRRRISISPSEIEALAQLIANENYKNVQYNLGHIQIRITDDLPTQEAEKKIKELVTQLDNESFEDLAYNHSQGPKALQGGDWGWLQKEAMPTIFADQIGLVSEGDILGPFRSSGAYHLLKIKGIKGIEKVTATEVNARHILITPTIIMSDVSVQKQLSQIRQDILSGKKTFAEMAKEYSEDLGSAANKGELGFQSPDIYVPEFKEAVETLPIGEISQPFKTMHGWHITEVIERRDIDRTTDTIKNQAHRIIFNRKFSEEMATWAEEIRGEAYVEKVTDENDESNIE